MLRVNVESNSLQDPRDIWYDKNNIINRITVHLEFRAIVVLCLYDVESKQYCAVQQIGVEVKCKGSARTSLEKLLAILRRKVSTLRK